ncbi:MAG: NUDIX domain-containing protein [Gottschalkiaceae bacterium]|nr:MAG: NUDIX domain-containing protein [Gottschalkiaceae bacterium]
MSESISVDGVNESIEIKLGEGPSLEIKDTHECVVFIFYNSNIVMVFNSKKKLWEFPTGFKKQNETILDCAIRESFEKTGAIVDNIFPIGYYTISKEDIIHKTSIYIGNVSTFETRPEWCEAELVKLFDELPYDKAANQIYEVVLNYINSEYRHTLLVNNNI